MTEASCASQFSWMTNGEHQSPCQVAGWLFAQCTSDPSSMISFVPLTPSDGSYQSPQHSSVSDASESLCTCSWAFYNLVQACTACQSFTTLDWLTWSSNCTQDGLTTGPNYWPATIAFKSYTSIPRWAIVNPQSWTRGIFNPSQAQLISEQNLPDAIDTSDPQPCLTQGCEGQSNSGSNKKTPIGAIVGGVVGGVAALVIATLLIFWLRVRARRRRSEGTDGPSTNVDLGSEEDKPIRTPHFIPSNFFDYHPGQQSSHVTPFIMPSDSESANAPPPANGGQGIIQNFVRTGPGARGPSVAEQLSEKRRRRSFRRRQALNQSLTPGAAAATNPSTNTTTPDSSPNPSSTPATTGHNNDRSGGGIVRLTWHRARGTSTSSGSDITLSDSRTGSLSPISRVSTTGAVESSPNIDTMFSHVPGARRATQRERQEPPPEYTRQVLSSVTEIQEAPR